MALPKKRHTKSRRNSRRSHHALSAVQLLHCKKCGKPVFPHVMCENCGTYKGREVVDVLAKLDKKERKKREKEQKEREKEVGTPAGAEPQGSLSMEGLSKKS